MTFAVICAAGPLYIPIGILMVLSVMIDRIQGLAMFHVRGILGVALGVFVALAGPVLITTLLLLFFACVSHAVLLLVLRRDNAGFRATFRANAYSSLGMLLGYIPAIGGFLFFYGFYLLVVGIREFHSTSTTRAVLIVLVSLPVALILLGRGLALLGNLLGV